MRQSSRLLLGSALTLSAVLVAPMASAAKDVEPPAPNVLLLVDTSGSMEYKSSSASFPTCDPTQDNVSEKSRWIESVENYDFYLHHRLIQSSGLDQVKVQSELANFLKSQPHVVATYTAAEMKDGDAPLGDPYFAKVLESFHPERSGDVMVVCQPYFFASSRLTGTTHGSPHPYDTHVPLMLLGGNFQAQIRSDPTTPLAASVILAQALGIPFPSATEKIPVNLFQPAK